MWMLVAVVDVALLAAAAGPLLSVLFLVALVVLVGGVIGVRQLGRRERVRAEAGVLQRRA